MGVFKAGTGQPEKIEPVVQDRLGNGDAQRGRVGEIRKPQPAGFLHLAENNVLLLAAKRTPGPDAPLKRVSMLSSRSG